MLYSWPIQLKNSSENTLFGLYDLFVGGAFSHAAIFAARYYAIHQRFYCYPAAPVQWVPYFAQTSKEGEEGAKKSHNIPVMVQLPFH